MTTAAIRGALILGAAILGLLVVTKAFPDSAPQGAPQAPSQPAVPNQPAVQPSGSLPVTLPSTLPASVPPTTATGSPAPGASVPAAGAVELKDLAVQVLNGTNENGLAASVAQDLEGLGVDIQSVGNASRTYPITTLFYRDDAKTAAESLAQQKFPGARLEPASNNLNPKIQVTVVIGEDYAAQQPG